MEFQQLVDALSALGLPGLGLAAFILIAIFIARKVGVVASSGQAQLANVILSAILAGLSSDPTVEKGLLAIIASVLSALLWQIIQWATGKIPATTWIAKPNG